MNAKGLIIFSLLLVSQLATSQVQVVADATVSKRVLKLQADVSEVDSSSTVVVTNIRLVDVDDPKKISYFSASATKETLNTTTGEYSLIENTSEYICSTLGYGNTVPNSRKKNDKVYLMMGEFIASSEDGANLTLVAAKNSFDNALWATSCNKTK